ncbi:hypothetical protein OH77DRAFT_1429563 [Trametes cingulata]|nr:hypothetical protein OH77DRAFT_1429563 [Trametes cingulata]
MHIPYPLALLAFSVLVLIAVWRTSIRRRRVLLRRNPTVGRLDFEFSAIAKIRPGQVTRMKISVPSTPLRRRDCQPTVFCDFSGNALAPKAEPSSPVQASPQAGVSEGSRRTSVSLERTPLSIPTLQRVQPSTPASSAIPPLIDLAEKVRSRGVARSPAPGGPSTNPAVVLPPREVSPPSETSLTDPAGPSNATTGESGVQLPGIQDDVAASTPFLIRHWLTAPKSEADGDDDINARRTWWFETRSDQPIPYPPDLTRQGDLQLGDLFLHRYGDQHQLWHWVDETGEGPRWKSVHVGSRRADGRRLTLTPKKKQPSWVGEKWFIRRGLANRL